MYYMTVKYLEKYENQFQVVNKDIYSQSFLFGDRYIYHSN